jgi:carbon storage regulator CsrA
MAYLVLGRKVGQTIEITTDSGDRITVMLVSLGSAGKVRIGVDAPGDCTVHRGEVQRRIDNGESFGTSGHDGPEHTDGPQDAAATDGHVFQVPREGE